MIVPGVASYPKMSSSSKTEARKRARSSKVGPSSVLEEDDIFGYEATPGTITLPPGFQDIVLTANLVEMNTISKPVKSVKDIFPTKKRGILWANPLAQLSPTSFYMELNATKGVKAAGGGKSNIPGEQRIPLEAVWSAQDFWGWPDSYSKSINPGATRKSSAPNSPGISSKQKLDRIYHSWQSKWKISEIGTSKVVTKNVRMYYYESSSDFRFTSGDIANWGTPGDIVKITRVDNETEDFTCELVKMNSPTHGIWKTYCKQRGRSKRVYGFT